jgi:lipopolysaccharide/colanic/teichoic acid biosynthesis glycosyltransferase
MIPAGNLNGAHLKRIVQTCTAAGVRPMLLPAMMRNLRRPSSAAVVCGLLLKRLLDLLVAGAAVVLLSPLLVLIAALIRLDSPGPVFFRQQRLGLGGKPFRIWKFRTMVVDAERQLARLESKNESQGGVLFKMQHDPRVTALGRFLRSSSLDELPQLFNVLQGNMSLVGPRPLQLRDCEQACDLDAESFARRCTGIPGITGLWQVSGRSGLGFDDMLDLDLDYIEHWSFLRDLELLVRTIPAVLMRRGAC